jgi:hypothetical protein
LTWIRAVRGAYEVLPWSWSMHFGAPQFKLGQVT